MTDHDEQHWSLDDFNGADVWHGRPLIFILIALGSAAMIGLIIVGWSRMNVFYQVLAPLGGLVFVWMFVRAIINISHGQKIMLAIGPRGILDWRVASAWMPWPAIVEIAAIEQGGKVRGFRVKTSVAFAAGFPETILSRVLRWSNVLTTIKGFAVGFGGLDGSADEIMRSLDRYFPQWRNAKTIT
jgi:hypothetical protein